MTEEKLAGVVERITFHSPDTGWTVLKVSPFREPNRLVAVLVHQAKVFAGATMEFWGSYSHHPKHGEQFKAVRAIEKKPASAAALEKYLGSGLIKGVGPVIAKRIVSYFNERTLEVFEKDVNQLLQVPGIAEKKLLTIVQSWDDHRSIRDVMLFLQDFGISTLFATKIFKTYGKKAIQTVSENPYRLAQDIFGIGFFSADRIALAMGFERTGTLRIQAGVRHTLSASREQGHCYLTEGQILAQVPELLRDELPSPIVRQNLVDLTANGEIKTRTGLEESSETRYYAKSLFFEEAETAKQVLRLIRGGYQVDQSRIESWTQKYCEQQNIKLSDEQLTAVFAIPGQAFAILTGGPGCGKTTTLKVLVRLLRAMNKNVLLAAPTGRAAQRMSEVIGLEAKTIHRLLEWIPAKGFQRNRDCRLECDFLVVDETSMLDVSLACSLLQAVPERAQVLFIGDPDQLPAVGAGNVLSDLLKSPVVPRHRLTQIFRQAEQSSIIRFAHAINRGEVPQVQSLLAKPTAFQEGLDCLFVDAEEATRDQLNFIHRARIVIDRTKQSKEGVILSDEQGAVGRLHFNEGAQQVEVDRLFDPGPIDEAKLREFVFHIPDKFRHVDFSQLDRNQDHISELKSVLRQVHPWSALHFGMTALDSVKRLYQQTIPRLLGEGCEIQILAPQIRGSLGTMNLNLTIQELCNPGSSMKRELRIGDRIFRVGDRVIQTRNNYDLAVFNGDIGKIASIDLEDMTCTVDFSQERIVEYSTENLSELSLAYAITIHKSQGSEFQAVIIPVLGQHFNMLFRNLIYTGLTRAKKLAIFVGSRRAFAAAIRREDSQKRQTSLTELLMSDHR